MERIRKARREWFGAIAYSESPGFTAFVDQAYADQLALPAAEVGPKGVYTAPLDAHLAVTNRCNLQCPGCYRSSEDGPPDLDLSLGRRIIENLARLQVFTVSLGGGEPLLYPHLFDLARHARTHAVVPQLTTNGLCMDAVAARECRMFGSVHLSYHRPADVTHLIEAAEFLRARDIRPRLNLLLTRDNCPQIGEIFRWARAAGFNRVLALRFKLTAANSIHAALQLTLQQEQTLIPELRRHARRWGMMLLVDCSLFPAIARHRPRAKELLRWDVNGCQGGNMYMAIDTAGGYRPCSFWPTALGHAATLTRQEWIENPELVAFRSMRKTGRCVHCDHGALCNGGCRLASANVCSVCAPPTTP